MCSEREEDFVHYQDMLEVVDDALPVQEVHGDGEEIPVHRPRQGKGFLLLGHLSNSDDLLETDELDSGDDHEDIDVASKHGGEETSYHDQCPDGSRDESSLLLLVL